MPWRFAATTVAATDMGSVSTFIAFDYRRRGGAISPGSTDLPACGITTAATSGTIVVARAPRRRLAVFDVDGTLVDSQNGIVAAQRSAFAAVGLEPPSRQRSLSIVGLSLAEAFTVLVGADGPVGALSEAYRAAWHRLRASGAHQDPLFPGAAQALATLKAAGFGLGVATGKSHRGMAYLIDRHGWKGLFDTIQTADDWPSKPAPDMLLAALADTGVEAADAAMIGDTSFDMTMARAAGVPAVGVGWGYHPPQALAAAGAGTIVASFDELVRLLG